jgi:predicted N-formylglutamate amidohydrolase
MRQTVPFLLLTCEHASAFVPEKHKQLLRGSTLRGTHRELDIGALAVATFLARQFKAPLYAGGISRLLVDMNRSAHNPAVLSPVARELAAKEQRALMSRYHAEHWEKVRKHVAKAVVSHRKVLHIAVHSFTPVLVHENGHSDVRNADVGLLYDPGRSPERVMAQRWVSTLREAAPELRVRRNYPYQGKGDGLATSLRGQFSAARYVGFELELNQSLLKSKPSPSLLAALVASLVGLGLASTGYEFG